MIERLSVEDAIANMRSSIREKYAHMRMLVVLARGAYEFGAESHYREIMGSIKTERQRVAKRRAILRDAVRELEIAGGST